MNRSIGSWPRRIRDSISQEGFGSFALRVLLRPVCRAAVFRAIPDIERPSGPAPVTTRLASEHDAPSIARLRPSYSPEGVLARLRAGDDCFLYLLDGQLAGFRWLSRNQGSLTDLGLVLPLLSDEVWGYESYVHPAYRSAGVNRASRPAFDRLCVEQGIRRKLGMATLGRRPFGLETNPFSVATIRTLRLGPFKKFWLRTYGPEAEYWRERLKELRWA